MALAYAVLTGACSALLKSDDATFRGAPVPDAGTPLSACSVVRGPTQLFAPRPRRSAWLGTSIAARSHLLAAVAPFENDAWDDAITMEHPGGCEPRLDVPDPNIAGAGAVYIYELHDDASWTVQRLELELGAGPVVSLFPETVLPEAYLGGNYVSWTVALTDAYAAVGIAGDAGGGSYRGSVHVFGRTPSGFVKLGQVLRDPLERDLDLFGAAVAISNDFLAISAVGADIDPSSAVPGSGAVFVYRRVANEFRELQRLAAPVPRTGSLYGARLAVSADTLIVSAPLENHGNTALWWDTGAVYVYSWDGQRFSLRDTLRGTGNFGAALALSGSTLAVGSPAAWGCNGNVLGRGTVQVYSLLDTQAQATCLDLEGDTVTLFGYALALRDEVLVVGAPLSTGSGRGIDPEMSRPDRWHDDGTGSVYLFQRTSQGWNRDSHCLIKASAPAQCDSFGVDVAIGENFVAVGTPFADAPNSQTGEARDVHDSGGLYVFPIAR